MTVRSRRFVAPAVALVASAGCGLIHQAERSPAPPVTLPEQYGAAAEAGEAEDVRWWTTFEDPRLERVMQAAFTDNLGLMQAFARLAQAQATLDGANAGYWPSITAEASVSRSRSVFNFGDRGPAGGGIIDVEQTQYNLSLGASYEVDLWGRVHSLSNAAELDFAATEQDLHAAAMSLSAAVAETWFRLAEQVATERLLVDQVKRNETQLELVQLRFDEGLADAVDVLQQRQVLAASKTQLPPVRGQREVLENQLAVLLGAAPGQLALQAPGDLPALPPLPAVGVPADLVTRRPDVRSAQLRVAAADYRVGAALAARFPTLRLTASTGFRAFDIADLLDSWIWNLAAGLVGPIFDGGRLAANQDLAEAQLKDRLLGYGQVVLDAIEEVSSALAQEQAQKAFIVELEDQLEAARMTHREAYSRYANGLSEYLPVLTALREVQSLERAEIGARRQLLSHRIQLCRALGGTWMAELDRPEPLSVASETDS